VETQQSTYRNEMPCWREIEIERELGERRERERLMREMGLTDEGECVCGVRDGLDRWRRERCRWLLAARKC
jgi:hypothetical protein